LHLSHILINIYERHILHCTVICGAVYCLSVCVFVCEFVTTIIQNCMHRSSPNWVCRWR